MTIWPHLLQDWVGTTREREKEKGAKCEERALLTRPAEEGRVNRVKKKLIYTLNPVIELSSAS